MDNVQHIYVPNLPRGRYDLQVVKYGGISELTPSETYALAFQFYPISPPLLNLGLSGGTGGFVARDSHPFQFAANRQPDAAHFLVPRHRRWA